MRQDVQELSILIAPNEIKSTSIESIYSLFLFPNTEFLIIEHIFFKKFNALDYLSESLFISLSTLQRTIVTINQTLASLNFQIDSQTFDLVGNESSVCNFMIHYFEEKYRDSFSVFSKLQLKALNKLVIHALNAENITINYPDLEKIRVWSMVILYGIKAGHRFTYSSLIRFQKI